MNNKRFSQTISVFHGKTAPEPGNLVGYGAVIDTLKLAVPIPNKLAFISEKRRQYTTENWLVPYTQTPTTRDPLRPFGFCIKI